MCPVWKHVPLPLDLSPTSQEMEYAHGGLGRLVFDLEGWSLFLVLFSFALLCPVSFFDQKLRKGKTDSECVNDRVFWVFFFFK